MEMPTFSLAVIYMQRLIWWRDVYHAEQADTFAVQYIFCCGTLRCRSRKLYGGGWIKAWNGCRQPGNNMNAGRLLPSDFATLVAIPTPLREV